MVFCENFGVADAAVVRGFTGIYDHCDAAADIRVAEEDCAMVHIQQEKMGTGGSKAFVESADGCADGAAMDFASALSNWI